MSESRQKEGQFLQIFLRNENDLKSYARALLPTWAAVDDVMQEASLVMWQSRISCRTTMSSSPGRK